MKKIKKSEVIVDCALELLKEEGDHGLTMRQVAQRCGMSLSNAQYYFKSKDDLLKAMADRYFNLCLTDVQGQSRITSVESLNAELSTLLYQYLKHGLEVSEMCRIFREYWAIATRNEAIEEYLVNYYRNLTDALADKLEPVASGPEALNRAVSIIIPYVEGYTITARSLPMDIDEVNAMLTTAVESVLTGK
ncbi:MAG: TetR/AcrR family transcriptional regulator [Amphritea sp.]|nr:TetR/AcrR family transcriptional regulator [Amphritea sp.]